MVAIFALRREVATSGFPLKMLDREVGGKHSGILLR